MNPVHLAGAQRLPAPLSDEVLGLDRSMQALPCHAFLPLPTGIDWLTQVLGGGYHPQHLYLLIGRQNVGKTIFVLQTARFIAKWAAEGGYPLAPILISFEHDLFSLFTRLLCMESSFLGVGKALDYAQLHQAVWRVKQRVGDQSQVGLPLSEDRFLQALFNELPDQAFQAYEAVLSYASNLVLVPASRVHTSLEEVKKMCVFVQEQYGLSGFPLIDYLQTLPPPEQLLGTDFAGKRQLVIGANLGLLKDFAVQRHIPVLAVSAVRSQALVSPGPVHLEDADGPESITYTIDGALVLNQDTLAQGGADQAQRYLRLAVEKNRNHGPADVARRHALRGASFFIQPQGQPVDGILGKGGA